MNVDYPEQQVSALLQQFEQAHSVDGCHGFLCALNAGPSAHWPPQDWLPQLLATDAGTLDALDRNPLVHWQQSIAKTLSLGERLILPLPLNWRRSEQRARIQDWAIGFMDAVLMDEDAWYAPDEQEVAELLLPFVGLAQLFDDPELNPLYNNQHLLAEFSRQLPELVTDVYLFYHAEP